MINPQLNVPLKWNEPAAVRRREWAAAISKERGMILLISTAAILLLRVISRNPKSPSWPVSVLIAIGGGAFFGILMPWFVGLFPSQILVSVKGINRNAPRMWGQFGFMSIEFWKWEVIRGYKLTTIDLSGRSFRALELWGVAGRLATIGLAKKTSEEAVMAVMREREIPPAP
jgi:hypothetical protein